MMEDKQIGVPTNVAVFIDYENVYKALLEEKTNDKNPVRHQILAPAK